MQLITDQILLIHFTFIIIFFNERLKACMQMYNNTKTILYPNQMLFSKKMKLWFLWKLWFENNLCRECISIFKKDLLESAMKEIAST